MRFVSLHHHTTFSYQDGFGTPEQHASRAAELGMWALANTEHGNVSGHVQHEKACRKYGIKPIFGLEAYMHPEPDSMRKFHMTLLAESAEGYRNLMRIVSRSWSEGFYKWPTVSGQMLADHAEGIVVLSGCSDSLLACSLLGGKTIDVSEAGYDRARTVARRMQHTFGDRFYLECQAFPELSRTRVINQSYEELGRDLGIPLVGTCDVHYPKPDDNEMQLILHATGRGGGGNTVAKQAEGWEYDIRLTFPTSDREVFQRLRDTGLSADGAREACRSTVDIAERCTVELPRAAILRFPVEQVEPGMSSEELIWHWMRKGWKYRVNQGNRRMTQYPEEYRARLEREMRDIKEKDFIDYFLMNADAVSFAKDSGIAVGPARGSAAASLVCYLLRITEIDPLLYPLMFFERFIDPTRTDIPDIDLDFAGSRRHEVRTFLEKRYGPECVGNIANYVRYRGKNSLDDVARVKRIPKYDVETVKGMIIERSGGDSRADSTLEDTAEMFPQVAEVFERWPELWKATRLEGNYRGMSVHAAGLVVTNLPISHVCATYMRDYKDGRPPIEVVSVDKYDAEYLNLLKVDFLGLNTMEMIEDALGLSGLSLEDIYRVPLDEPKVMEAFRRNDVVGIFQFEGRATQAICREVRPDNFMELADINALSRPGPLFSQATQTYIDVKHGIEQPKHWHSIVDRWTRDTKFQIIYQEQILKILEELGGLPVAEVHEIRKIISKKLGEAKFNESAESFADGAGRLHGISKSDAHLIWGKLVTAASYAFNVAHSISYSMLAFWAMWLKVYHTASFYTAQLRQTKKENWIRLIRDAERHDIEVRGVRIGESGEDWTRLDAQTVAAGYRQLHGVGQAMAPKIVDYFAAMRRLYPRIEFQTGDLLNVSGIGTATLAKMRPQLESDDPFGLLLTKRSLDKVRAAIHSGQIPLGFPTESAASMQPKPEGTRVIWIGMVKLKEYKDWVEDERARTGESFEEIRARIDRPDLVTSCFMHSYDDTDEIVYVRATRKQFPKFKARIDNITPDHDVIYIVGRKSRSAIGSSVYLENLVVIDPDAD